MLHHLIQNASPLELSIPLGQLAAICSSVLVIRRILAHAARFRVPACQRKIIGILWIIPIYSVHSIFTFSETKVQLIADLIRDSYEAFVLYMFFSLTICILCEGEGGQIDASYLQRLLADIQKSPQWLLYIKRCILQYAAIRVAMTILGIVLTFLGLYEDRLDLYGPFLYMTAILSISCSVALYYLAQWYSFVKHDMQFLPHLLMVKFAGIKTIISLSFLESVVVSLFMQQYLGINKKIPIELQNILLLDTTTISRVNQDLVAVRLSHLLMSYTIPLFTAVLLWGYPVNPYLDETHPRGTLLTHGSRRLSNMSTATGDNTTASVQIPFQPLSRVSRAPQTSEYFGFRDTFADIKFLFREPRSDFSLFGYQPLTPLRDPPFTPLTQIASRTSLSPDERQRCSQSDSTIRISSVDRIAGLSQFNLSSVLAEAGVSRRSHEYSRLSTETNESGRSFIPSVILNPERHSLRFEGLVAPPRLSHQSVQNAATTPTLRSLSPGDALNPT
eukprot:GEMP01033944.1.p1 GENE.GEMP01033944.1~~GEMP01033944.1.p1  ORF type:complete len:503 (+),score=36.26 GEMP01033944.1:28-1536(+)